MAKTIRQTEDDDGPSGPSHPGDHPGDLVVQAQTDADALGRLYEMYYERIFRFCIHRLFYREVAEDVTSTVFLEVARRIRYFTGRTEQDFKNWLYAVAVNQANAYIRKSSRRRRLFARAAESLAASSREADGLSELDWPRLYAGILALKPEHQTIVTLRFFENLPFEQIAQILDITQTTARVTLHRALNKLRENLQKSFEGET